MDGATTPSGFVHRHGRHPAMGVHKTEAAARMGHIVATGGVAAALGLAWLAGEGSPVGALLRCPLRAATGIDCPGCGATRAVHALLSGRVDLAADHNLLATIAVPLLVAAVVAWWIPPLRTPLAATARRLVNSPTALRIAIAVAVVFTVVRNTGLPLGGYLASGA